MKTKRCPGWKHYAPAHDDVPIEHFINGKGNMDSLCKDCKPIKNARENPKRDRSKYACEKRSRFRRKHAEPKWVMDLYKDEMNAIYHMQSLLNKEMYAKGYTRAYYHVDHIVPVGGKNFTGLHVPWNLRIIPAHENYSKRNHLITESETDETSI